MAKTSFLGKLGSFFGLEDDEVFEEQAFTQPPRRSKPQATSVPKPQAASQANAGALQQTSSLRLWELEDGSVARFSGRHKRCPAQLQALASWSSLESLLTKSELDLCPLFATPLALKRLANAR